MGVDQIRAEIAKTPGPSQGLITLAFLFVPVMYLLLIVCAAVMMGIIALAGYGIYAGVTGTYHVPARLLFLMGLLMLGAVMGCVSVLRGLVASILRRPPFQPALRIPLSSELELSRFITSLCHTLGAQVPNSILIHAEPTFYVTQGKIDVLNGRASGRILAIGLPLLAGLKKNEFRAILAHEFAHFTGGDTVYSARVLPVYSGTETACASMSECMDGCESLSQQLPMWLPYAILMLYLRLFHLISMRISREREKRADTVAAIACGSQSFKVGLMKVVGLSATFWDEAAMQIVSNLDSNRSNYYSAFRMSLPKLADLANQHYKQCLAEPQDVHDSHPSLKSRLDYLPNVPERSDEKEFAVSMLAHLDEYEKQLGQFYDTMTKLNNC